MLRILNVALLLCIGIGITAHAADQDRTKAVKIRDAIYMSPATGNVYMVTTPAGNVIVHTALSRQAPQSMKLLVAESHGAVKYIILTHGHADHIGGISLWKEAGTQI